MTTETNNNDLGQYSRQVTIPHLSNIPEFSIENLDTDDDMHEQGYIDLDRRTGVVSVYTANKYSSVGCTPDEVYGHITGWAHPPLFADEIHELLTDLAGHLGALTASYDCVWDGSNFVAADDLDGVDFEEVRWHIAAEIEAASIDDDRLQAAAEEETSEADSEAAELIDGDTEERDFELSASTSSDAYGYLDLTITFPIPTDDCEGDCGDDDCHDEDDLVTLYKDFDYSDWGTSDADLIASSAFDFAEGIVSDYLAANTH